MFESFFLFLNLKYWQSDSHDENRSLVKLTEKQSEKREKAKEEKREAAMSIMEML